MGDGVISVRLDAESQRALEQLIAAGRSQSEAIRHALVTVAHTERVQRFEEDARRLSRDPANLELIAEIQSELDQLRAW